MDEVPRKNQKKNNEKAQKSPAKQKKKTFFSLVNWKWVITVFISSLSISIVLSILSSELLNYVNVFISILILLMFVVFGVIFDIIGLGVATASEKPFHSMSARKIPAGKKGLVLIKNAEQVSSFCNDVIGDICGVASGSTAAAIAIKISSSEGSLVWLNLLICGLVSAFTVGAKAVGKALGMNYSTEIVTIVAKILSFFSLKDRKSRKGKEKEKEKEKDKQKNEKTKKNPAPSQKEEKDKNDKNSDLVYIMGSGSEKENDT